MTAAVKSHPMIGSPTMAKHELNFLEFL